MALARPRTSFICTGAWRAPQRSRRNWLPLSAAESSLRGLWVAFFFAHRSILLNLASAARLPTIYETRRYPDTGGLMSYGPDIHDLFRRAAIYVNRIFEGEKPADLPVEQPTKFELVINLRTAKTLELAVPDKLVALADDVIE
jgi:putative ABC transport system substrate-binding protein